MSPTIRTSSDLRRALAVEIEIARGLPAPDSSMAMAALANAITYSLEVKLQYAQAIGGNHRWNTNIVAADERGGDHGAPDR